MKVNPIFIYLKILWQILNCHIVFQMLAEYLVHPGQPLLELHDALLGLLRLADFLFQ